MADYSFTNNEDLNVWNLPGVAGDEVVLQLYPRHYHLLGTLDDDIIVGTEADNIIYASLGRDTIDGGAGGNDKLRFSAEISEIHFGADNTTDYVSSAHVSKVVLDIENHTYQATWTGSLHIFGSNTDGQSYDVQSSGTIANIFKIYDSIGDDIIYGSRDGGYYDRSGENRGEFFYFRGGQDFVNGRRGSAMDTVVLTYGSAATVDAGIGRATSADGDVLNYVNIDQLILTSHDDVYNGSDAVDIVTGGAGADILHGGTGKDQLRYSDDGGFRRIVANMKTGVVVDSFGDIDTIDSFEKLVGTVFNDRIIGSGTDEFFWGNDGNDTMSGGGGKDYLKGQDGDDIINGDGNDDEIYGGRDNDTLMGDDGDDTLVGDDGADAMEGGFGADTVDYSQETGGGGVTVDLAMGTAIDTFGNTDTLEGIEIVIGTSRDDSMTGSNDADRLSGQGGVDMLSGGDGGDTLEGGARGDTLLGGTGDDLILGGSGADQIDGGDGNDDIDGGSEGDTIYGGIGEDTIDGGDGRDIIDGGSDNDQIDGGEGNDDIDGGAGDDTINGGVGNDTIDGGDDDDTINGGDDNDTINGGRGRDTIDAGDGNDVVRGGGGDDTILIGKGSDTIDGGAGRYDTIMFQAQTSAVRVDLDAGIATQGGLGSNTLTGIEVVSVFDFNNLVIGDDKVNLLFGGRQNDRLRGQGGDDLLQGSSGSDILDGGDGDDKLEGDGSVSDITHEYGNDKLSGGAGDDELHGGHARDTLDGGADNDLLFGEEGNDRLSGGSGRDVLDGGAGDDLMTGDAGRDIFVLSHGDDTITDFQHLTDRIDFSGSGEDAAGLPVFGNVTDLMHHAQDIGGNTVFRFAGGTVTLTVEGILPEQFDLLDFIFAMG